MRKIVTVFIASLFLTGAQCQVRNVPVPTDPGDSDLCAPACEHLRDLGCEEGDPLEDGTTCEMFCLQTQTKGHRLNLPCVIQISSCEDLFACTE